LFDIRPLGECPRAATTGLRCRHPQAVSGEHERLAFEAAQRALDKQERLLEELRSRTEMQKLFNAFRLAAAPLVAERLLLVAMVGDTVY
jgi:hypothetical protein